MKKISFLLMIFFAVVQAASGQTIEYRNNCLDSCNLQTNTVFELKSSTPFPNGTTFAWTIDGRAYPVQTNKSSIVHQFVQKGTYNASVSIQVPGQPVNVKNRTVYIGAIRNGNSYGFMINGVVKDTLIELCTGSSSTSLAVPSPFTGSTHTFRWFPNGETSQSISVDKEGCYSVKVFETGDLSGCFYEAHSKVKICGSYPNMPPSTSGSGGTGTAATVPECVNCPQWDLGNNVKVIFPTDGRPPYSELIPSSISYNAPANVAYVSIYNKGANYQIGGLSSNGKFVIDNQNNLIGPGLLNGNASLSNGVSFIPKKKCKGCNSIYYLITTAIDGTHKKLYYHTIDLSMNTGKGGFLTTEGYLSNIPVSEKISVVKTTAGYQLLSLDESGENLLSFSVDEKGISEPITTALNAPAGGNTMGNMNLSLDNSKLAIALPPNKIKILNTSPISNFADLTVSSGEINGVCFSPDGNLLYVSVNNSTGNSNVLQFKLDTSNIQASNKYVLSATGKLGAIQLDPARKTKLYITRNGQNRFFTIDRPNTRIYNAGTASSAGYNDFGFQAVGNLGLGLPTIVKEDDQDSPPSISMECKGTTYTFKLDKDLCENNKNTRVVWELWYALNSNNALNPILDISTGQKIVSTLVSSDPSNRKFVKINSSGSLNQIEYDFKINTSSPDPDGYYVVVVRLDNACVSNYLLDAQAFFVRNLKPYLLPRQFDIIRAPLNCPPSALVTIKASPTSSTPPVDTYNDRFFTVPNFPLDYKWILPSGDSTFADNQQILYPQGQGNYSIQIKDPETACKINNPTKVVFYTPSDIPPVYNWNICMDEAFPVTKLEVFPNSLFLGYDWKVLPAPPASNLGHILNPIPSTQNFINVDKPGEYQIEIRDNGNCILNKNYIVDDKCLPEVIAPTVFNPHKLSSDGSIARFYPLYNWPVKDYINQVDIPGSNPTRKYEKNRVKALSFKVFNRWGQLVFERDFDSTKLLDPNFDIKRNGWDGTYNGNLVPQDTYAWVIEYESNDFPNLGKQSKSGAVLVVY